MEEILATFVPVDTEELDEDEILDSEDFQGDSEILQDDLDEQQGGPENLDQRKIEKRKRIPPYVSIACFEYFKDNIEKTKKAPTKAKVMSFFKTLNNNDHGLHWTDIKYKVKSKIDNNERKEKRLAEKEGKKIREPKDSKKKPKKSR